MEAHMKEDMPNRQWVLVRRPRGQVSADLFRLERGPMPQPNEGEIVVRNQLLSCDPTQLGWMTRDTYAPAVPLGEVMRAFAAGEVVTSRHPEFAVGQRVQGLLGWQDLARIDPVAIPFLLRIPDGVPLETGIGLLGLTGLTAYFGLAEVGRAEAGETVLVSGAAGATGQVVGQMAKILGCRVVGIAGGPKKCGRLLDEFGFDAAIDYKHENLVTRLRQDCPNGVDVFFDNVGGDALDAALLALARHGRVVICGAISTYTQSGPVTGPRNYLRLLTQRGRMEGFLTSDFLPRAPEAIARLAEWWREGKLRQRVDVVEGFENAPAALARLFTGDNQGKQLVRI